MYRPPNRLRRGRHFKIIATNRIGDCVDNRRWRAAGHTPQFALGHSIGEVAAACVAGLCTVDGALATARVLGVAGCACAGLPVFTAKAVVGMGTAAGPGGQVGLVPRPVRRVSDSAPT